MKKSFNGNERPMSHRTCVTIDLNKPVAYQTSTNENPVIVSYFFK
jgi:hypothetical protein